jgi:hypothetical protein
MYCGLLLIIKRTNFKRLGDEDFLLKLDISLKHVFLIKSRLIQPKPDERVRSDKVKGVPVGHPLNTSII